MLDFVRCFLCNSSRVPSFTNGITHSIPPLQTYQLCFFLNSDVHTYRTMSRRVSIDKDG